MAVRLTPASVSTLLFMWSLYEIVVCFLIPLDPNFPLTRSLQWNHLSSVKESIGFLVKGRLWVVMSYFEHLVFFRMSQSSCGHTMFCLQTHFSLTADPTLWFLHHSQKWGHSGLEPRVIWPLLVSLLSFASLFYSTTAGIWVVSCCRAWAVSECAEDLESGPCGLPALVLGISEKCLG
jgi:hypothetical protein